jgi:hypothetical protein
MQMAEGLTIADYANELVRETWTLHDYATQAAQHVADDDLQGACNVAALSHNKISAVTNCRTAILHELEKQGITPGDKG